MTKDADQLLAEALKTVKLNGSFDPAEVGGAVGLSKSQSESAARELANAGILVLGFDSAAHFSSDYRKAHTPSEGKTRVKKVAEEKKEKKEKKSKKKASQ